MISVRNLRKNVEAAKEELTLQSTKGWFHGGRSRDRPMGADEALKISAFYRAVDIRSDSISRLPVTVKDTQLCIAGKAITKQPDIAKEPRCDAAKAAGGIPCKVWGRPHMGVETIETSTSTEMLWG